MHNVILILHHPLYKLQIQLKPWKKNSWQTEASQYMRAELLYKWIVKNINYSSQGFRQDNYVPQLPMKVIEDKLGDCKDLSALYLTICKEAGIDGHFCLVNMDQQAEISRHLPSTGFNHCITRIYPDDKPLFVELTSENLAFARQANYASYGYALVAETSKKNTIIDSYQPDFRDKIHFKRNMKLVNN